MKTHFGKFIFIFAAMCLLVVPLSAGFASNEIQTEGTVVRIAPAARTVAVGGSFKVEIWVDNVIDLYGADIKLAFDPTAFEVVGGAITLRYDLLQPELVVGNQVNNSAGTIWYAATQLNPTPPASGSGALFEFQLRAKRPGVFPLNFTNHQLAAIGAEPIPHTIQEALYTVEGEPGDDYRIYLPLIMR
jgi:hypothetical protein